MFACAFTLYETHRLMQSSSDFDCSLTELNPLSALRYELAHILRKRNESELAALYTVLLLEGQSGYNVVLAYAVEVVTIVGVGVVGDGVILAGCCDVESAPAVALLDAATAVVDFLLLLFARLPPTPPPIAAARITTVAMAAIMRNFLRGIPHIVAAAAAVGLAP
jgi:hypothetical protein